ncbi:hypothetical protein O181_130821 [Austropuccinia psidii MF-1]|uniref:Reverse transcriptase domain-containing protein n=1 Tax=Austropuccinia psidii MF-1 TaxID=1389203 RepID=A0A9Q3L2U7_9BASI|nr:hypothetical protein [Austropuccinia psidii MF-1]
MPFGIKNAPSHFQRMINEIFPEELSEGCVIIYIDVIIVSSKTWGQHMYRLSRVFTKIQSVNMKISLKKCHLRFQELKALGHEVSGLSLGIDKKKIAAVFLKPTPQNNKGIQSFLWFGRYHSQHIEDFASIERPLYELCDKDTVFEMPGDRFNAFESLRQALTTSPLLLMPDFKLFLSFLLMHREMGLVLHFFKSRLSMINLWKDRYDSYPGKSNQLKPDMEPVKLSAYAFCGH